MNQDPMSILNEAPMLFRDQSTVQIGMMLRNAGILVCVILIAISLVAIIFSGNPQNVTEHKKNIINKLFMIFVITSLVVLFNLLKGLFDGAL